MKPDLSVIGLGKLGAPVAAALASRGFRVIGVDRDPRKVDAINNGSPPVYEPALAELLVAAAPRLSATGDTARAVRETAATFVIVPTPCDSEHRYSCRYVRDACDGIARALSVKREFHLIVISSTVMPGTTEGTLKRSVEELSGLRCGEGFGLCFNPEFMAIGSVIRDFLQPDLIVIGESDARSGDMLREIYRHVCENDPPIARMNLVNAELAKIALNSFVTARISFANQLAHVCERLPGANVDTITAAIGLDSRIGPKCLRGGLGYGGPCFPYDNQALQAVARQLGLSALIPEAVERANHLVVPHLVETVKGRLLPSDTVGVLGLTYKPDTDVVEQSQALEFACRLAADGVDVIAYDPAAIENARAGASAPLRFAATAEDCCATADVVVLATPWKAFRELRLSGLAGRKPRLIIDCWRLLDPKQLPPSIDYLAVGVGTA